MPKDEMNAGPLFDLLSDAIIRVDTPTGSRSAHNLPEILAMLSAGENVEFSGLQAHQSHAWHAFLCQVGAMALHAGGTGTVTVTEPAEWRALLLQLADGRREPWCLVVPDLSQPAFLQPPVPEGSVASWQNQACETDRLDILVTAKNHAVKRRRVSQPEPEHWVYALTSLQTSDGFAGKNNYGIIRMNGGYGNRAGIAVAASDEWSVRFRRDCTLLLKCRAEIASSFGFANEGGVALLALDPWDGTKALHRAKCDPFVIEICRRVRLSLHGDKVTAHLTGTTSARLVADETKGNVGDPWIPVRRSDAAGLTAKSLSYNVIQDVLFGADYDPSLASLVRQEDGESPVIVGRILVRGQGKTEGYFERTIPCPPKARTMLASLDGRQNLGAMARERVDLTATVRNKILKPAILNLLQGGPEKLKFDDERSTPFIKQLEQGVDDTFFPFLFDAVDLAPDIGRRLWIDHLLGLAHRVLNEAVDGTPIPIARRYRAIAAAERSFRGAARNNFPDSFQTSKGGSPNAELTDGD